MNNIGDIIGIATTRGVVDAVITNVNYRTGSLTAGAIPAPAKPTFFKGVMPRHVRAASGRTYTKAQVEQAKRQAIDTLIARRDSDDRKRDARRSALGETKWETGKGWTAERCNVGDVVRIQGRGATWTARVVRINLATGKVGIERYVPDFAKRRSEEKQVAFYTLKQMGYARDGQRGPRAPSDVRWIDPRFIVGVEGRDS